MREPERGDHEAVTGLQRAGPSPDVLLEREERLPRSGVASSGAGETVPVRPDRGDRHSVHPAEPRGTEHLVRPRRRVEVELPVPPTFRSVRLVGPVGVPDDLCQKVVPRPPKDPEKVPMLRRQFEEIRGRSDG